MKKAVAAFTLLIIAVVGCHKDNDNITIQGKWIQQSTRIQQYSNNTSVDDTTYLLNNTTYEFADNGTAVYKDEDGDTLHFTYTYNDNTKKLVTQNEGDSYEYNVTQLTSGEMMWHEEDSAVSGANTYKLVYDISFHR